MKIQQLFTQAIAQLRQQPLISAVSVMGTAFSLFLIMLMVMIQQVKTASFAPESNRDRFLHVTNCSFSQKSWGENSSSNGAWYEPVLQEVYKPLKTPEAVTIYSRTTKSTPVNEPGKPIFTADVRETDADFWQVFDFVFLNGKPYDEASFLAGIHTAVITKSVALQLFGTTQATGREFLLAYVPYRVSGVVKDVSTLATTAYGQVWIPYSTSYQWKINFGYHLMGLMSCTILAKDRSDFDAIREEALRSVEAKNRSMKSTGLYLINRNRPYDQETNAIAPFSNAEPDLAADRQQRWFIYLILLLVPAINLSSMTQSRLRQRVSELGVRRAFGATRTQLMGQLLGESLIITLLAGALGLLMSIAFAYFGNELVFTQEYSRTLNPPMVNASILIHASTFGWALVFCFLLNLISTIIPAWRASRKSIVESLNGTIH